MNSTLLRWGAGVYFKELDEYLKICFGDALDGLYNVHVGDCPFLMQTTLLIRRSI